MAVTKADFSAHHVPATQDSASPLLDGPIFGAMWRLAEAMAGAKTVPAHLQKSPGDCLRVVELAHRCGQSPFALADHTFFTSGKLALDGQAMMALINAHPKIQGSLDYEYSGDGAKRQVRVIGRLAGESKARDVIVTLDQGLRDSKGARARWETDGDQMLAYYGARKWARRHAPEVTMGLYTPDEIRAGIDGDGTTMRDVTPADPMPLQSPHREVEDALKAAASVPLFEVFDGAGDSLGAYASVGDALKAYGDAKASADSPQSVAISNLPLLRAAAGIASGRLRDKLLAEISAAEAIQPADAGEPELI